MSDEAPRHKLAASVGVLLAIACAILVVAVVAKLAGMRLGAGFARPSVPVMTFAAQAAAVGAVSFWRLSRSLTPRRATVLAVVACTWLGGGLAGLVGEASEPGLVLVAMLAWPLYVAADPRLLVGAFAGALVGAGVVLMRQR